MPSFQKERSDNILDVMTLMVLPDHLRKTALTLLSKRRATAEEIAQITLRARAVESAYLNTLATMGYIGKERKGRKAFFFVDMK